METIYSDVFLTVELDEEKKCIIFHWTNFFIPLEGLKKAHAEALKCANQYKISTYIADTATVKGTLKEDCIKWWIGFIPMLYLRGIKKIITIVPKNALELITTKVWQKEMLRMQMINVGSIKDALKEI